MRFSGKVAVVVGGGSHDDGWSNGKACAVSYAREGAQVAVLDIDASAAGKTAQAITDEGGQAIAVQVDVCDLGSVTKAIAAVIEEFGQIDVLHNNVGVTHMGGPVDLEEETFQRSLDLNLGSVYRTCKAVLPLMIERRTGAIVNVSSLAAIRYTGYPYFAYYAAKAAVNHATTAIAMEHAPNGIRANAVMPGLIDSPLIYRQIAGQYASPEEMVEARNRAVPLGQMGTAWDIAEASLFLASDAAKFITGVSLPVDGGQSCRT